MGAVPILGESGSLSPLLATVAGGVIGYMLAGWKGSIGGAMVVLGANNLGLAATDKPMLRLGVAALGIGVGGYFVHMASKASPVRPNPPKWLKQVEDEPEELEDDE